LTWIFVVLQDASGGALVGRGLGLVMVAGIFAAVLLAPVYQFLSRSCWEKGIGKTLDPKEWRRVAQRLPGAAPRLPGLLC
jgi:hypothetical protein